LRRIRQLDGLRAFAFLAVFLHHALLIPLLWAGVDLFFVLSGFLITSILIRSTHLGPGEFFGSFYLRRFRRIVPPYALFLLIAGLCYKIEWGKIWYWYAFFASNIADSLRQGGGAELTPLWSLSVEEQFYLCWPLLVFLVPIRKLSYPLYFLVVAVPLARWVATPLFATHFPIYFLTPFRSDLLAAGGLIAWYSYRDPDWPKKHFGKALFLMAGSLVAFVVFSLRMPNFTTGANTRLFNSAGYSLILLFVSAILVACLGLPDNGIYRILTRPLLMYLGKISYSMYLIHEIAIWSFGQFQPWARAVGGLALTVCFGALSWELMEKRLCRAAPKDSTARDN
jgi:peptidoglycan/LPS O-acetylase OafA/YrhL